MPTVLVTLAASGGSPRATMVGKVISAPPPATEFAAPAAAPAAATASSSSTRSSLAELLRRGLRHPHLSARVTVLLASPTLGPACPTAVQAVEEEQETAASELAVLPSGLGVEGIVHSVPFQVSARVVSEVRKTERMLPAATQELAETQETPRRATCPSLAGAGLAVTDQVLPFQRSERAFGSPPLEELPTAMQKISDVQEIASSTASVAPEGFGADWVAHSLPFQRSTNGLLAALPTATQ